jgi:uncharacterized protein YkwD
MPFPHPSLPISRIGPTRVARSRIRRRLVAALVAVCATLAAVFVASPGASASLPAISTTEITIAYQLQLLLNRERAQFHLAPLASAPQLRASARYHNVNMARANAMSHQLSGEPSVGSRETMYRYWWRACGENIAWNSDMTLNGATYLQNLMFNERAPNDGHRLNILNKSFRNLGVDVYMDKAHHKMWITIDFGTPR